MKSRVAVGIDLGGTTLSVVVIEQDGSVCAKRGTRADIARGPDAVIRDMVTLVDAVLLDASLERYAVIGVGVGAPGPLSHRSGRIIKSANLAGWVDVPIRDRLSDMLELPVTFDNDASAAAFGEFRFGAGEGAGDLVMLTLGTGVGAGVILDGRVLRGHFENAAELGHMIVVCDGLRCACGQRGCLEAYASATSVAARAVAAVSEGKASALSDAIRSGEPIDSEVIARFAAAGDALCLRIWDEACYYLAVACINIQHAFNPRTVVLGGGMSEAGSLLLDRVTRHVSSLRWSLHEDLPSIVLPELGRDAGAIGAAGLALCEFAEDAPG